MGIRREKGFIVIEILIAGLILTASIAATMYLFRMGFEHLERANQSNILASKLTQATGLFDTLDLQKKSGEEDIGEGIKLKWDARLLRSSKPIRGEGEFSIPSFHELSIGLYSSLQTSSDLPRKCTESGRSRSTQGPHPSLVFQRRGRT